jgi:hypothetical protein
MTGTPPESSSNRWEPSPDQTAAEQTSAHEAEATAPHGDQPVDPYAATYAEPVAAPRSRRPTRAQSLLAGGAAAVLLTGGVGGFAIGRATAADDGAGRVDQQGFSSGFDREGDDDDHGFQGGGPAVGPGEGFAPPDGQAPGMDGDDRAAEDDDGSDSSDT